MFKIIPYQHEHRDDTIYCFLLAKGSLGRAPRLNDDMLDIPKTYFDKGDMFWLAMSNDNRVIGMIGTSTVSASDMWLKRLFIMPSEKRKRLGSALLSVAEEYAISKGIKVLHTRFPDEWFEANQFYPANGFIDAERFDECRNMVKQI